MPDSPQPGQTDNLPADEVKRLRSEYYNASVLHVAEVHRELRIIRIVADAENIAFAPGQYLTLGLGNWEPRVAGVDPERLDDLHRARMCKRAFSISCSMLDDAGVLRRPGEFPYLEFYVVLVRHAAAHPPALTPRLFGRQPGSRLFAEPRAAGRYTLDGVEPNDDVFFFATGTGEAPHNAMIAELLATGHGGRIVSVVCVRHKLDAAYRAVHEDLMRRFPNYHYSLLTTREPENVEPAHPRYAGKQYLQDIVRSGRLERETQVPLDPAHAHVYLCGNPDMIGIGHRAAGAVVPAPGSMLEVLTVRGFKLAANNAAGNLHFERYW